MGKQNDQHEPELLPGESPYANDKPRRKPKPDKPTPTDELARLREVNAELVKALGILHPKRDTWRTPNDDQAREIDDALTKARGGK